MLEVADAAKKRSLKKVFALNFIYEIHSVVSPEIYLTAINYDGGGEIILRGVSNAMSQVFEFLNALEKSKYFQDVKTKFVTTRNVNGKDLTEFEIVCPLEAGFRQQLTGE
jgi:Tfp pilus assembly protein PilN